MENKNTDTYYINNMKEIQIKFINGETYVIDQIINNNSDLSISDTSSITIETLKFYPILKKYFDSRIPVVEINTLYEIDKENSRMLLQYNYKTKALIDMFSINTSIDKTTNISFVIRGDFYVRN